VEPWWSPWPADHLGPLVVVGFSTTPQNQVPVLPKVMGALGGLRVRELEDLVATNEVDGAKASGT
jgi:hypothetical protein